MKMDKTSSSHSSDSPSTTTSSGATAHFLRQLNKSSHKISKPLLRNPSPPPSPPPSENPNPNPNPNQPPVYNISKADFRDVVQKLTGSPAHDRLPTPTPPSPPLHLTPKPPTSRLHRIRPPPLSQIANRPPSLSPLPPLPSCHAASESPISAYMRFLHTSVNPPQFGCFSPTGIPLSPNVPPLPSPRWKNV